MTVYLMTLSVMLHLGSTDIKYTYVVNVFTTAELCEQFAAKHREAGLVKPGQTLACESQNVIGGPKP